MAVKWTQYLQIIILACQCNMAGIIEKNCSENEQCVCKSHIIGEKCDRCEEGYTMNGFPKCQVIFKCLGKTFYVFPGPFKNFRVLCNLSTLF